MNFKDIADMENKVQNLKQEYERSCAKMEVLLEEKKSLEDKKLLLEGNIDLFEKARIFLQHMSEYARILAKKRLEEIVTNALKFVFGEEFSFKINIGKSRNRPEAEFLVCSKYGNTSIENIPQDARGGGIVDIVSIALRVALLETHQPKINGPIILDEPFKHVSAEYINVAGDLLKIIRDSFNRQIIMVTHNESLKETADKTFLVSMENGISQVTEM